jgi:hypothetical protein
MAEPMLKNGTDKAEKLVLSESDSLRCENLDLKSQVLKLRQRIFELELSLYDAQETAQKAERVEFMKKLGVDKGGRVSFIRQADGRYEVSVDGAAEKK